jgi:large subunit ribosomal protein L19e
MELKLQKRLASQIIGCSPKKVRFDESRLDEIKESITKNDIRALIKDGGIERKDVNEQSRYRARLKHEQKRKKKQKGHGSRKGTKNARSPRKTEWINRIRAQREILKNLKSKGKIENKVFRDLYLKSKGGTFRSRRHLKLYLTENELVKK